MDVESQRYAPPTAEVGDVVADDAGYQAVKLWPAAGRMERLRFFVNGIGFYVLYTIATAAIGFAAAGSQGLTPRCPRRIARAPPPAPTCQR